MHYYKRNLGDYAKKCGRLNMLQHGAYTLLLDACYDREEFPTLEQALEWTWASSEAEIEAVKFVLSRFFIADGDRFIQTRIQQEMAEFHEFCHKQAINGVLGGRPKKNPQGLSNNPTGLEINPLETQAKPTETHNQPKKSLTTNHKPLTTNQEPIEDKAQAPIGFVLPAWIPAEAWDGFVEMRAKQKKPMTPRAKKLLVNELERMKAKGQDVGAILDQSTKNAWSDIYELKKPKFDDSLKRGSSEYAAAHKNSVWWVDSGFESIWNAMDAGCYHDTFHKFSNGKKLLQAIA